MGSTAYQGKCVIMLCLPKYTDNTRCNANSASNALNKWLHANYRNDIVIHGFRHALKDRLRAVSCPSEMIDQIGGWSKRSVGKAMVRYTTPKPPILLSLTE